MASDWYAERLRAQQTLDTRAWARHIAYLEALLHEAAPLDEAQRRPLGSRLQRAHAELKKAESEDYVGTLNGFLGADPAVLPLRLRMGNEGQSPELGKNRIEALSDGIFAVAMTLLVFEFHVPALPHTASNILVAPALLHLWPKFVTYAVSFLSLGVFWIGHHNMYHAVRRADRVLLGLSILFFMFVAFLPFSTSVLNAFMETQVGLLFFGANLTIIGWLLFLQWAYATTQPGMMAEFVTPEHRSRVRFRFLLYPVVVTLTMLLCFWSVPISLAIYLLLLPAYVIPSAAQEVPRRRAGAESQPGRRPGGGGSRRRRRRVGGVPAGTAVRQQTGGGGLPSAVRLGGDADGAADGPPARRRPPDHRRRQPVPAAWRRTGSAPDRLSDFQRAGRPGVSHCGPGRDRQRDGDGYKGYVEVSR